MSLRFGILGLLAEKPLHGYEVKTRFESLLGGTWEVNIGQIYSTLQRLERDGLVAPADDRGDDQSTERAQAPRVPLSIQWRSASPAAGANPLSTILGNWTTQP